MRLTSIVLTAAVLGWAMPAVADEDLSMLPITMEEALDASTLQERIVSERRYEHPDFPGKKLRLLRVEFYGFEWKDGPWTGHFKMYLPEELNPELKGMIAFTPGGVGAKAPREIEIDKDLMAGTALTFGIPVCSVALPLETHFEKDEIHRIFDWSIVKFMETKDPAWIGWYPYAALNMRAYTCVGEITGAPTRKVVSMGTSITAALAFVTATYDPRVVGVVMTGSVPYQKTPQRQRDFTDEEKKALIESSVILSSKKRYMYRDLIGSPLEVKNLFYKYGSRAEYADKVNGSLLQVPGSNDYATEHLKLEHDTASLSVDWHVAYVPGYPHGCAGKVHMNSLRMFIDHHYLGRSLSKLKSVDYKWNKDGNLQVTAVTEGEPKALNVEVQYFQTDEERFYEGGGASKFKDMDHYTNAVWSAAKMTKKDGIYSAKIDLPKKKGDRVAFYVKVDDHASITDGHVTSFVHWIERPSQSG